VVGALASVAGLQIGLLVLTAAPPLMLLFMRGGWREQKAESVV
jgi:hypothetical protein